VLLAAAFVACGSKPSTIRVGVTFETAWQVEGHPLDIIEKAVIRETAFRALEGAFDGFDVRFLEDQDGGRRVRVGDTEYGPKLLLGAVGLTSPVGKTSHVRFDALVHAQLIASKCVRFASCNSRTRLEMIEGLGRGLGATIAHELGHQAAFGFAVHSGCDDCYDSASTSLVHFFGRKRWSDRALEVMRRVLPAAGS
jgi:hypothetical protein